MSSVETGIPRTRRLRTPRPFEIVLVLSLAFNAFIIGGFICSVLILGHPPGPPAGSPEHRMDEFARAIGVDPRTSQPFQQMRAALHDNIDTLHRENHPLLDPVWLELAKPQPDAARIRQMMLPAIANREDSQRKAVQTIMAFVLQLTPDQRARFVQILSDRKNPQAMPLRGLFGN